MKNHTSNILSKFVVLSLFLISITACQSNTKNPPLTDTPPSVVDIDEEIEQPVAQVNQTTKNITPQKEQVSVGVLQFKPGKDDQQKYNTLRTTIKSNQSVFFPSLRQGNLRKYSSLDGVNLQEVSKTAREIIAMEIEDFLTRKSISKVQFEEELNNVGTTLGYSLIEDFGNSKDQSKFLDVKININTLANAKVIQNPEPLRLKLFEAELNSKTTFTKGNENLSIKVGEDGKVYIKQ